MTPGASSIQPLLLAAVLASAVLPLQPAVATVGGPDGFGYTWDDSITFNYETATTALGQGDYDYDVVSIGFAFLFYGQTYSQITIASDGVVHFDGATYISGENTALPTGSARLIAPFWDNLRPDGGGDVYYGVSGVTPNRVFIVEWRDVPHYASYSPYYTSGDCSIEVKLYEADGGIEFHYQDVEFGDATYDNGASATIGIQDGTQGYALERSFDTAVLANSMAIRFEPCGDDDGDGYEDQICGGEDCDDSDPNVKPLAQEIACDWIDNNCDGTMHGQETDDDYDGWDECLGDCDDTDATLNLDDADGDGFDTCSGDCDDTDAAAMPGGIEICDGGIDNDCDGVADDVDADGDGYIAAACGGDDCDDAHAAPNPVGVEVCDGLDNDCNGVLDDEDAIGCTIYLLDGDGDGFGVTGDARCLCAPEAPYEAGFGGDCDDTDAAVNPAASEICNWIDDNCNGNVDEGFDLDGDTFSTCDGDCDDGAANINPAATEVCNYVDDNCDGIVDEGYDADGDGYSSCAGDCDDGNAAINPLAVETCDGVDENCDGFVDEPFDVDQDGATTCAGDCDDNEPSVYPGAAEICDGLDNNCDGKIAPAELDNDHDGWPACAGDCDDDDPYRHPDAPEQCNGIDDDCDGVTDEDTGLDQDGDGFNPCQGDCNDKIDTVYPEAEELCDGLDNDCNGHIPGEEADVDGDGYHLCDDDCDDTDATLTPEDLDGDGYSTCDYDCDDTEIAAYPDNPEVCDDDIDNDCDGTVDFEDSDCTESEGDDDTFDDDEFGVGCECRTTPAGGSVRGLAVLLALLAMRRRR